jgi:hypothetical protein
MTEDEGRVLAARPKLGEPAPEWTQQRPNTLTNSFGVVDEIGKTIRGLHVEFDVFISPRLGQTKYVFSLMRVEFGRCDRAYQLEINGRAGLRPTDHAFSHEHYGQYGRLVADNSWANASFDEAVQRFCAQCNLTLTGELPDFHGFELK